MKLLELRFYPIDKNQHRFQVSVEGQGGEVHYKPALPFQKGEDSDEQNRASTIVKILESTKFDRQNFSEAEQDWMVDEQLLLSDRSAFDSQWLSNIGRKLYQVLGQSIQQVIEASVADAKRDRTWLHIRLRFPADVPQNVRLTDYPWELLYNEYGFLAHQGVIFSRYIAYRSPCPNLPSADRLNVLLISAGAGDDSMNLKPLPANERDAIAQGIEKAQKQGAIQLESLTPPTFKQLRKHLLESETVNFPHVLHFDSHGFFGKRCNQAGCKKAYKQSTIECECGALLGKPQGYLVFERSDRTADYVSAQELGELLGNLQRREQPNFDRGIALVVLSSCKSGMSRLSESVFNGVAQNLIGQCIPAVVAMSYSISVVAASAFAEAFYHSLGQKESLAIAFRRAQSAIGIEGNQWYRPVLYLRWEDNEGGQLFKPAPVQSGDNLAVNSKVLLSDSLPVSNSPQNIKRKVLTERLAKLTNEYELINQQIDETVDEVMRSRLEQKANRIFRELDKVQSELSNL
jgi:CHAT domain/Effector-associated domain 9